MEWLKLIGVSLSMILIGFIVLRLVAKRNFSDMNIFHIFLVLMLANVLSEPIKANHFFELMIPAILIVASFFLYSYLLSTNTVSKNMKIKPVLLIKHGNLNEKGLNKAKITIPEMLAELRAKGVRQVSDVEFAILEETGKISVIPVSRKRGVHLQDLSLIPGYEGLPVPLVIDGVIQYDNLAKVNLSPEDFHYRLAMQGYNEEMIKTISFATLDEKNNIFIDQNDDVNQGNINQEQQGLIKKIQEDMKASSKEPEDDDLEIIDDYIKS